MVLLEKLWDDLVDRSDTNNRIAGLHKINNTPLIITGKYKRTKSVPAGWSAVVKTPAATTPVCKDSLWGSGFYPELENHSTASSAGLQLQFNIADHSYNGLWSEEAKGKQSLMT